MGDLIFVKVTIICLCFIIFISGTIQKEYTKEDMKYYKQRVRLMFEHAYNGYLTYAYPYDELRPITCDGHDTWGSYSLTLIDALDTLAIIGNYSEFQRVAKLLLSTIDFDQDINVSVFETNIRIVGGLLSAHLLSMRAGMELEPGWPCTGPLLRLAEKVARKLLPAFNTSTGMAYGTVNLLYGVPNGETPVTCTAGIGTFIVEFGSLSRLTGDPIFEQTALQALNGLWTSRSSIGLVGNHVDVVTGKWTAVDAGIGAGVDSYFEYLVKGSILFQNADLKLMFNEYKQNIDKYLKKDDWFMWSNMNKGSITMPVFQSLEAFWPGLLSLTGDIDQAMKTIHNYHQVWKQYGFTPEFYNIPKAEVHPTREGYPLRPELIESAMYLYQATHDPYLIELAVDILEAIEHETKTKCGYATVKDVQDHHLENRMESFFLAETTKYLYLMFDEDSFIHNTGAHGTVINTPGGQCVIDAGGYVFNTEAHPVDAAAIYCCSSEHHNDMAILQHLHDNIDLLQVLGLVDPADEFFPDSPNIDQQQQEEKQQKHKVAHLGHSNINFRLRKDLSDFVEEQTEKDTGKSDQNSGDTSSDIVDDDNADNNRNDDDNVEDEENGEEEDDDDDDDDDGECEAVEVKEYHQNHRGTDIDDDDDDGRGELVYETRLLTCPAQPFHMRLSLMGEMFPDD